jgi:hypothetical protein
MPLARSCHEQAGPAQPAAYRIQLEPERFQGHSAEPRLVPRSAAEDLGPSELVADSEQREPHAPAHLAPIGELELIAAERADPPAAQDTSWGQG